MKIKTTLAAALLALAPTYALAQEACGFGGHSKSPCPVPTVLSGIPKRKPASKKSPAKNPKTQAMRGACLVPMSCMTLLD